MLKIPCDILKQFEAVLVKKISPVSRHADYLKWLRYYLDFRSKYQLPASTPERIRLFIEKLRSKNQTPEQQEQAAHALSLFFEMVNAKTKIAARLTHHFPFDTFQERQTQHRPLWLVDNRN